MPAVAATDIVSDPALLCTHRLPASGGHVLHVQEFGNPDGLPAVVLHGGPGSGSSPLLRRFFDPARFRIICPDQRGAGASQPHGATAHNTTPDLVDDLRALRRELALPRWLVVGGSWGATLALVYAAAEPDAVSALLLRASFLARRNDIDAFFHRPPPDDATAWQSFAAVAPADQRHVLLPWLTQVFAAGSAEQQAAAARAWWGWEQRLSRPGVESARAVAGRMDERHAVDAGAQPPPPEGEALAALVGRYRVQAHYMHHACWLESPTLLERLTSVLRVPTLLLHGTADRICPPDGARALHERLPHSRLHWVEGAGHNPAFPAMAHAMRGALDHYAAHAEFRGAALGQSGALDPCATPSQGVAPGRGPAYSGTASPP
jgi:proline iminopeptidase